MITEAKHDLFVNKSKEPTVVELAAELVVRAALHDFGNMLCFLIDGHGPDNCTLWWVGQDFDLNGTCLGNLAV